MSEIIEIGFSLLDFLEFIYSQFNSTCVWKKKLHGYQMVIDNQHVFIFHASGKKLYMAGCGICYVRLEVIDAIGHAESTFLFESNSFSVA